MLANPTSINNTLTQKEKLKNMALKWGGGEVQIWGNSQKIIEKSMFLCF